MTVTDAGRTGTAERKAAPAGGAAPEAEAPEAAAPPPPVVSFNRPRGDIVAAVAEAYRRAALAEADMVEAAETLETVRRRLLSEAALFPLLGHLDNHVARNHDRPFLPALLDLREWTRESATAHLLQELREAFDRDAEQGRAQWLQAYAECLVWWRSQTALALVQADLPLPQAPFDFVRATRLLRHERWADVYPLYTYLARESRLEPYVRAQLLAIAAQIQFYFLRAGEALPLLQEAQDLSPNNAEVLAARARYYLDRFDYERASRILERVRALDSSLIYGYTFTGDLYERQNNLEEAERWYRAALREVPGHVDGYTRLIDLYGRPELIEDLGSEIPDLVRRAVALSPEADYGVYTSAGYAYRKGKRYEAAHEWFERAIVGDPARLEGYVAQGDTYVEEGAFERAQAAYEQAIDVAPEAMDGYWGLAWHFENQEKWQEAIRYYEEAQARRPQWEAKCQAKAGYLQWKSGRGEGAPERLLAALRSDPADDLPHSYLREVAAALAEAQPERAAGLLATMGDVYLQALPGQADAAPVLEHLHQVAADYVRELGDEAGAERLCRRITDVQGPAAGAAAYSRLGNLHYHAGDYEGAAEAYRRAAELDAEQASYRSNLGYATRRQERWEESNAAFARAMELNPHGGHQKELAHNYNERANAAYNAGQYHSAIEGYEAAIALNPDDAVFTSNMARAWEMLVPAEGRPALEAAVAALQKACERAPDNEAYGARLRTLQAQRQLGRTVGAVGLANQPVASPILIEVSPALAPLVWADEARTQYRDELRRDGRGISGWCSDSYGFNLPPIHFALRQDLQGGSYVINLHGSPRAAGELQADKQLFLGREAALEAAGIDWDVTSNPFNGNPACLVDVADVDKIDSQRNFLWSPAGYALLNLGACLRTCLAEFIDHQTVHGLLVARESAACRRILGSAAQLTAFTLVLRALVDEFVSIKELDVIAGAFLERWQPGAPLLAIVQEIRCLDALRPLLYGNQEDCDLLWLGPDFEKMLAERIRHGQREPYLALEPQETQRALQIIREAVAPLTGAAALAVAGRETRPFVRKLVELEFPYLAVIARDELLPGYEARNWGLVAWEAEGT